MTRSPPATLTASNVPYAPASLMSLEKLEQRITDLASQIRRLCTLSSNSQLNSISKRDQKTMIRSIQQDLQDLDLASATLLNEKVTIPNVGYSEAEYRMVDGILLCKHEDGSWRVTQGVEIRIEDVDTVQRYDLPPDELDQMLKERR